jgi:hypothetical protein
LASRPFEDDEERLLAELYERLEEDVPALRH